MIKNIILTALLIATPIYAAISDNVVTDQIPGVFDLNKPMKCMPVNSMFNVIQNMFEEKLLWIGKVENTSSYIAMYKNALTGNWTIIQHDSAIGCFLAAGKDSSAL
jgi:hypothetical protein